MMYNYPFFGFPSYRSRYYKNNYNKYNPNVGLNNHNNQQKTTFSNSNIESEKVAPCDVSFYKDDCFDFFGLKLHFDDILIIALLFFLYKEEIDDVYLFIALFLLLLC